MTDSSSHHEEEDSLSSSPEEDPIEELSPKPPAESLEKFALRGVLTGLHELTSSKACSFAGSGGVELTDPVRVSVSALNGDPPPFAVSFPGTQDLSPLIKACSAASFGKGPLQVYDQSYRNALELNPKEFVTSFSLAEYDILPEIARLTNTDGASLTAKLYKLNLYQPGDFFKSHLDTPRDGLIGSLVVCLPHEHTGGTLKAEVKPVWKSSWDDYDYGDEYGYDRDSSLPQGCEKEGRVKPHLKVGGLLPLKVSHECTEHGGLSHMELGVPLKDLSYSECIHWVNGNLDWQTARVSLAYGNEWSIDTKYSAAAIIIKIKPFNTRFS
ncbi:hypothetical protein WJX73_002418 [Symbiochloris irregularis]|uniref:Uncharacterized protein n=1 Tax=Symbiochloris irregularis TaxID=706552 RepID=A0AAW1NQK6_9CHLO